MTVQKFVTDTEEEKRPTSLIKNISNKTLTIVPIKKRKYDIYDKNVYLNKRKSHIIAFGYLRTEQFILKMDLPCDLLEMMFKFYYNDKIKELLRPLPELKELIQEPQTKLFIEKLKLCETTLDFTVSNMEQKYENAKDTKTKLLKEITNFIADTENTWPINNTLPKLINMIAKNLFRSLPHYNSPYINSLSYVNDNESDVPNEPFNDKAWPHLELIYDIFWRVINTSQFTPAMMEQHLNKKFLENFVELFNSRQEKERQFAMMILHQIYGRCMNLRPIILKIVSNFLYWKVIYASKYESHYGINEILQIIAVIIGGLRVPVKREWYLFFQNVLVQLYKSYSLKMFWQQLTECCITYISKDIHSVNIIFTKLLKYWPVLSPQKEEIFINVISQILQSLITNPQFHYEDHKHILIKIVNKLAECMVSNRQTIRQATTNALQEAYFQRLIDYDRKYLLEIIVSKFHNYKKRQQLDKKLAEVETIYKTMDPKYWRTMRKYVDKQYKKNIKTQNNINESLEAGEEPWINIKERYDEKYKYRTRPRYTNAEKMAKRKYEWEQIHKMAARNKSKFIENKS